MENIPAINQRVKEARELLKLNQRAICRQLDLNPSYYSGVEKGKRKVTSRIIEGFRTFYGVSTDWLYTGNGEIMLPESPHLHTLKDVPSLYPNQPKEQKTDIKTLRQYMKNFDIFLKQNLPEYYELTEDIATIFNLRDELELIEKSKIGNALYFDSNITSFNSYEEYKTIGIQSIKEILKFKSFIHEFAEMARIFMTELNKNEEAIRYGGEPHNEPKL